MSSEITITLAVAASVGVVMQWTAQKTRIPALLLLIVAGAVLGKTYFHILDPETLGKGLAPVVTLSVALILFEGGLNLRIADAMHAPKAVVRLLTSGALISTILTMIIARMVLSLGWTESLLLGTILMVTGPTVVQPILRRVRVTRTLNSVLTWEGILIDPIGAVAAIVAFQIVLYSHGHEPTSPFVIIGGYPARMFVGALIGGLGGLALSRVLSNPRLAPTKEEDLNNLLALGAMLGVFAVAEAAVPEAGIVAATVAGIALANVNAPGLEQLRLFKSQIATVLIGTLFVLLAAPVKLGELFLHGGANHLFVALLILVVRPATVLLSTQGTKMAVNERVFAAFFAPRGIVAAAVASLFGAELARAGIPGAQVIIDAAYETILVTVALCAIGTYPVAWLLKVLGPTHNGVLIVGCHPFGRALASCLRDASVPVLLVDSNPRQCQLAEARQLPALCGSATDERVLDNLDFPELGVVMALTTNEEVNTLVCEWAKETVGPRNSFQARLETTDALSAASKSGLGGLSAFCHVLPVDAISQAVTDGRANVEAVDYLKSTGPVDNATVRELLPGSYVLGWLGKSRFRPYSPDSGGEESGSCVVLEVAGASGQ